MAFAKSLALYAGMPTTAPGVAHDITIVSESQKTSPDIGVTEKIATNFYSIFFRRPIVTHK